MTERPRPGAAALAGTLSYASEGVRSAPPRTAMRVLRDAALLMLRWAVWAVQTALRLTAYVVIGTAVILHVCLWGVAGLLLLVSGLRWATVRATVDRYFRRGLTPVVRTVNRLGIWMDLTKGRAQSVPFATASSRA